MLEMSLEKYIKFLTRTKSLANVIYVENMIKKKRAWKTKKSIYM